MGQQLSWICIQVSCFHVFVRPFPMATVVREAGKSRNSISIECGCGLTRFHVQENHLVELVFPCFLDISVLGLNVSISESLRCCWMGGPCST